MFVKYYLDKKNDVIYQASDNGVVFYLKKGSPMWNDAIAELSGTISENTINDDKPHFYNTNLIPDDAELISRKEAELTEDIWNSLI